MTPRQDGALREIKEDIYHAPRHRSEAVQASIKEFTQEDLDHALDIIDETLRNGDGNLASQIIKQSRLHNTAAVVRLLQGY